MEEPIDKIGVFVRRMERLGISVKLSMNVPWIYLTHINGKRVTETFMGEHGFTVAFYPIRRNQGLKFTDTGRIFELIRKYVK